MRDKKSKAKKYSVTGDGSGFLRIEDSGVRLEFPKLTKNTSQNFKYDSIGGIALEEKTFGVRPSLIVMNKSGGELIRVRVNGGIKDAKKIIEEIETRLASTTADIGMVSPPQATPPFAAPISTPEQERPLSEDSSVAQSLRQLKSLHDDGILTDAEYETKRKTLTDQL